MLFGRPTESPCAAIRRRREMNVVEFITSCSEQYFTAQLAFQKREREKEREIKRECLFSLKFERKLSLCSLSVSVNEKVPQRRTTHGKKRSRCSLHTPLLTFKGVSMSFRTLFFVIMITRSSCAAADNEESHTAMFASECVISCCLLIFFVNNKHILPARQ
jgi:hypothetical protein